MKSKNLLKRKLNVADIIINLFFMLYAVACIYPLLLVLGVSFSEEKTLYQFGYGVIPKIASLEAYKYLIRSGDAVLKAYGVTIFVTVVGTIAATLITALFAYPLSRREFTHRKFFSFLLFFSMLFGGGMVPWFVVCVNILHINDTIYALILPSLLNAWHIIILRTFMKLNIPDAVVDAARIDGSGELRTFFTIILPLSLPGLATVALFSTLGYWNDWWLPLMLVNDPNLYNLQFLIYKILNSIQYLAMLQSQMIGVTGVEQMPSESARMAMCIISIGPIILAYPFFQKYFIKGLTIGAVKG